VNSETEHGIGYLKVDSHEHGCYIIAKSQHSANIMEFFRSKAIPFSPIFQPIPHEDILEFSAAEEGTAREALAEWKDRYVATECQKDQLRSLKAQLISETDANKKRLLRKQIRRLSFALKGTIRPGDYFSTSELKQLDDLIVADNATADPD
jgi:hypothetical protein